MINILNKKLAKSLGRLLANFFMDLVLILYQLRN